MFTEAPILALPKSRKDFVVFSDASLNGLDCVLMQDGKLNLKQHHWIELLKDYDCVIDYHPEKANVIADVLSKKAVAELWALFAKLSISSDGSLLAEWNIKPFLVGQIKYAQFVDVKLAEKNKMVHQGTTKKFSIDDLGCLRFHN
ncbi:blue copper protein-like [Gossypium australe]|uniref:Blue copper protein-like n=1 Tax=Gossypium australe TaxID=47621 RepID=A0A5B6VBL2_9ROSI|nr:blue copper protein-like [Gossypium australe]